MPFRYNFLVCRPDFGPQNGNPGNGSSRGPFFCPRAGGDYLLTVNNRERCNPPNRIPQ